MKGRPAILAAALTAFFALAPSATAKVQTLRLGDLVDVVGTRIACQVQVSRNVSPGKVVIGCLKVDASGKPAVGSYAVSIAKDGEATAVLVTKTRQPKVVFRSPAAVAGRSAGTRVVRARVGDVLRLRGSDLGCTVVEDQDGLTAISCFRFSGIRVRAYSNLIGISDKLVLVSRVDARGKPKILFTRRHGA